MVNYCAVKLATGCVVLKDLKRASNAGLGQPPFESSLGLPNAELQSDLQLVGSCVGLGGDGERLCGDLRPAATIARLGSIW